MANNPGGAKMKKILLTVFILTLLAVSQAGILYTNITEASDKLPLTADSPSKLGVSSAFSLLGLITVGDMGLKAAMDNGGINKIYAVDKEDNFYLFGAVYTGKLKVYGE